MDNPILGWLVVALIVILLLAGSLELVQRIWPPETPEARALREQQEAAAQELANVRALWAYHRKTSETFHTDLAVAYYLAVKHRGLKPLHKVILDRFIAHFKRMYHKEYPLELPVNPRFRTRLSNPQAAYEAFLLACGKGLVDFTVNAPPTYCEQSQVATPLFMNEHLQSTNREGEYAPEVRAAYTALMEPFKSYNAAVLRDWGFFDWLNLRPSYEKNFYWDDCEPDDPKERRRWNEQRREAKKEHEQYIKGELKQERPRDRVFYDTPFIGDAGFFDISEEVRIPFLIPYSGVATDPRFSGTWIVGTTGSGKTNLLLNLILQDLETDASLVILDAKGELFEGLRKYRPILDRLIIIHPDKDHPLAINPLKATNQPQEFLEYIFGDLAHDADLSGNMTTVFRRILAVLEHVEAPTFQDFFEILQHGIAGYEDAVAKTRHDVQSFFEEGRFDAANYVPTRQAVAGRIERMLTNDFMFQALSSATNKVDLYSLISQRKVILIDNREGALGKEGSIFLGRFIIALIRDAARVRTMTPLKHRPCHLYIDECSDVIKRDTKIPEIIDRCRSQLISLTVAHQRISHVDPPVRDALFGCAIWFVNADQDGTEIAARRRVRPDSLSLPTGAFYTYVRRYFDKGGTVWNDEVETDDTTHIMTSYPVTTDRELELLQIKMWDEYTYTPIPPNPRPKPQQHRQEHNPKRGQKTKPQPKGGQRKRGDTDPAGDWDK